VPNHAKFAFYGKRTAVDNETFNVLVEGWHQVAGLWVPLPLLSLTCTQGASVGVAGQAVINTEYFADTIVEAAAWTTAREIISPANDGIALVKLDISGCELVSVKFDRGTNAECNGLWGIF